jgi:hypothetical protein
MDQCDHLKKGEEQGDKAESDGVTRREGEESAAKDQARAEQEEADVQRRSRRVRDAR